MIEIVMLLIAVNVAIQVLDIASTNGAIANGAIEANPIVQKFMDWFGMFWWVPKLAFAFTGLYFASLYPSTELAIGLVVVAGLYGRILMKNFRLWRG